MLASGSGAGFWRVPSLQAFFVEIAGGSISLLRIEYEWVWYKIQHKVKSAWDKLLDLHAHALTRCLTSCRSHHSILNNWYHSMLHKSCVEGIAAPLTLLCRKWLKKWQRGQCPWQWHEFCACCRGRRHKRRPALGSGRPKWSLPPFLRFIARGSASLNTRTVGYSGSS